MKPYTFKVGSLTVEIVSGREKPVEAFLVKVFCLGVLVWLLAGCSTLAQIGEIEGTGKVGEYLRAIESTRVVVGGTPSNREVAAVVNRTAGESRALSESLGSTTISNVDQRAERFGYIIENVSGAK